MPFSRYQIRNEFSLADPELYKAADKDDPEALLEGVAMAGLVGVLRQLGDLAEFAAEVFHGLHEEVMATAARGHGLLTRVQQVESDFPLIERAFLSQTGHSAFFSSPGISWHPNLQTEQNLITKGDLPRFVMDSYEESRGPPRLFLLDKFDVAGAGACLKRYTDPSIYKVEVSSYEMMTAEAQRDKKIRKTKKKGARWKNGDTPEAFQPSHVKLHQLLLEERVQNGASEPARRVKIKKRDIKFPFDTETGKGYMEKLLSSPPEDKLVHEVKLVNPPLRLPNNSSEESELETVEDKMVNSPLDDIEEKHISIVEEHKEDGNDDVCQSDDVASETDNYMDALATMESEVETDVELRAANSDSIVKEETFSDSNLEKQDSFSDSNLEKQETFSVSNLEKQETFSDSNLEKLQESQISDYESSPIKNQVATFSYSDSDSTAASPNNMSPRGINSPHAFASKEIPFRPRVLPTQITDNLVEASDNADEETIFKESDSKESCLIGTYSNNNIDVNVPTNGGDTETNLEKEDGDSSSTLVSSLVEEQSFDPARGKVGICEDVLESRYDQAEAGVSCSNEDGLELKDEVVSVDSESQNANAAVHDNFGSNEIKDLSSTGEPGENGSVLNGSSSVHDSDELVEKESFEESVVSPEPDSIPSTELTESDEKKDLSEESVIPPEQNSLSLASNDDSHNQFLDNICDRNENDVENPELELLEPIKESSADSVISAESDSILSAYNDHSNIQFLDNGHESGYESDVVNLEKESIESGEQKELRESDSIPSAYSDHSDKQFPDGIHNNENDDDANNAEKEPDESCERKELSEEPVISLESDSIPSAYTDHPIRENGNEHDVDNVEEELSESGEKESSEEPVVSLETDPFPSAYRDQPNIQFLDNVDNNGYENDIDNPSTELTEPVGKKESTEESDPIPSASDDHSNIQDETVSVTEKTVRNGSHDVPQDADIPSNTQFVDYGPVFAESEQAKESKPSSVDQDGQLEKPDQFVRQDADIPSNTQFVDYGPVFAESEQAQESKPSSVDQDGQLETLDQVVDLSKLLPELAPINMEEMPPLPPLPPVQWRMGRFQNPSSISNSGGSQADISNFPPVFPQIETHPSLNHNDIARTEKSTRQADISNFPPVFPQIETHQSLNQNDIARTEKSEHDEEVKFAEETEIVPQPEISTQESQTGSISEPEIIRLSSTSSLPSGDNEMPNGIRPMKIQRPRTPLIDAVATHDKNKLRKVAERAVPLFPKEEEKDTFLEQIRAKSFSLKPAVPTRPIIQGPTTNLRVAAILEKANAIRQAFAGSDDDENDSDSWSDS